jgi:hypothetical protein
MLPADCPLTIVQFGPAKAPAPPPPSARIPQESFDGGTVNIGGAFVPL